ncbi:hypothetical protein [Limobrevibacterium gyesilva]|uniref:Uncharacterized protein n=1 Tax=Limobrevibacterium gyesilva TaxID=2991712 RepID=A0AA41YK75_9PROT|nr:hypothetical protein [Limobrevibacterium gyesilva]MCW3474789.1 hypothetical protein [Limobrevibacterium gyesilva]
MLIVVRALYVTAVLAVSVSTALAYDHLATAQPVPTPEMPRPGYLQSVTDPAFGTPFTRVTDPGGQVLPTASCSPDYCTHRYATSQAWNADQSLLLIVNGCQEACSLFLDGRNFAPVFQRIVPNECEWHPTDAALMICADRNEIYTWAPRTDTKNVVYAPNGYRGFQFGPYKGNPSKDGKRLVVRATNAEGTMVAFAYDIHARMKYPDIDLTKLTGTNSYCSISPSGEYIFCFQEMPDETNESYIFTVRGAQIQHWTGNHRPGHGDMTIDPDGSDVYVGISKADPDKYHVIKRRLRDGKVTDLAPYGEGQHASIRSINRPGWVFLTYTGTYAEITEHPDWAPFYQEVVALRIDGSGEIRRIVQTRAAKHDYWSEAHASPSPDGSQVIWSSNWGQAGDPVADYVAELRWP